MNWPARNAPTPNSTSSLGIKSSNPNFNCVHHLPNTFAMVAINVPTNYG